ncbi:uncharacterized protein [Epargyreus clarus]|uniref:uncharacterized protein n=1 Tax=Epargyreus clarus TaxID=520877 RepID=UPI003C2F8DCF
MKIYKQIDCFRRNLKFWKFLGIYPLDIDWPFYSYYSFFFILLFSITYNVIFTINLYFLPRHIDNFIEELIFYFTVLAAMSKVLTFVFMSDKIKDLLNILESDMFQPETVKATKIIDSAKAFNKRYWQIYMGVSATSNVVHVMSPFLTHLILKVELILPICSYSFLSDDVKETFIYPLYFYQCIGMHFIMLYNVNIDSFILGLMILIIAQLEVLEEKMSDITADFEDEIDFTSRTKKLANEKLNLKLNKALIHYDQVTQ